MAMLVDLMEQFAYTSGPRTVAGGSAGTPDQYGREGGASISTARYGLAAVTGPDGWIYAVDGIDETGVAGSISCGPPTSRRATVRTYCSCIR
jgi:hypothetical protein